MHTGIAATAIAVIATGAIMGETGIAAGIAITRAPMAGVRADASSLDRFGSARNGTRITAPLAS